MSSIVSSIVSLVVSSSSKRQNSAFSQSQPKNTSQIHHGKFSKAHPKFSKAEFKSAEISSFKHQHLIQNLRPWEVLNDFNKDTHISRGRNDSQLPIHVPSLGPPEKKLPHISDFKSQDPTPCPRRSCRIQSPRFRAQNPRIR